ncbi:uncharacterized protein Z519_00153 [Cladophialophora bantiana CBS 173.52]|uniref:Transcription factor domain-containing protein n=1 Tax=Cladophialophora bantiana (strain ATCC 10958 / CBS 173.52 / CDC B-1940 / NIH 8579) TaxID=1442370 RepID=A0A0D2GJE4_CLAB1|nr:uncharacterized protein Z519_00153 [Cladophialophora bantiana CBS 173.52]KIW98492.1 hypothetical protein Z519_00153 [Cladophialophora bantiana CBS 173.52]
MAYSVIANCQPAKTVGWPTLIQKVQSLRLEIQQVTDPRSLTSTATAYQADVVPFSREGSHLQVADPDDLPTPSDTAYLGPGSSARLVQRFLTTTTNWHITNNIQIPRHLLPNGQSHLTGLQALRVVVPSFPINNDLRKVELHSLVPPSTQRVIIEHYLKIVAPEYSLLPVEQETVLLTHENPLKWISSNKNHPAASSLTIVFAISTALITRDLDANLANVSLRSKEDIQKLSLGDAASQGHATATSWTCAALCALALIELICPTSGQLWDLLGRAASTMQDLQEGCLLRRSDLDADLRRLERALLKLERYSTITATRSRANITSNSLATMHFGRPSLFFDTQIQLHLEGVPAANLLSDELYIASCLHSISRALTTVPVPTETFLEALIPFPLQVMSLGSEINLSSATLYTALNPLFTDPDRFAGGGILNMASPRMAHIIAKSASIIIDHFNLLNEKNSIISIWLAAERVLEAGTVWAASLVHQQRLAGLRPQHLSATGTDVTLGPIVKVSGLLASFAARWKVGSVYVSTWEIVVESLWKMV